MSFRRGPWRRLLARWKAGARRKQTRRHNFTTQLGLESLEQRRLLSVTKVYLNSTNSALSIIGSDEADVVSVSEHLPGVVSVLYQVDGLSVIDNFSKSLIQSIDFDGNQGDDIFTNATDIASTARGGDGNDILIGGSGADDLRGGEGDDRIHGGAGDDSLLGGGGHDRLYGGLGDDYLNGGDGNDVIQGEEGNDTLLGGADDDRLYGGDGSDLLMGQSGNDLLRGDDGDDLLYGGDGVDVLKGGAGDDTLFGGEGDDELWGELGNDTLRGENGNDFLIGNEGDDVLFGGAGDDRLSGGEDDDQLRGQEGDDLLRGGAGNDTLFGDEDNDYLYGDEGDDILLGGLGDDFLHGGNGNDSLSGNDGNDQLYGDAGNDLLFGNTGTNQLFGGDGDDELIGGDQSDLLHGEAGNDILRGAAGNDVLIGGEGVDSLHGSSGEDLLVGGTVSHTASLGALLTAWNSGDTYESRIRVIEDALFAAYLQAESTVFDDYVPDILVGGGERDWFFLTGVFPIYDPVGEAGAHEGSMGGHHSPSIVHELPIVEGFELIDSLDRIQDIQTDESLHSLIPHASDPVKRREHLALFELVRYDKVSHAAVSSGNWSDPNTWADGVVPAGGARVLIPIGVEVTIDKVVPYRHFSIRVDGTLSYATNVDTQLRVDTMIVSHVGVLNIGTAQQPIAPDVKAKLVISGVGTLDRTYDPFGISRGLITHGSVSMYGAEVTSHTELLNPIVAGTSVLQLAEAPIGWKVGDQIVIAGTQSGQVQDESRQILAIAGNLVWIDPLSFHHLTPSSEFRVLVANVTRNVIVESEFTDLDRRGHVMFMHNRDVQVHNAGFYRLGRTDKFQPINDSVVDEKWNLVPGTGTNPRARYPVHFHRNGTIIGGSPSVVDGSVVVDSPGWGIVNHSSYVDVIDNVTYSVNGAGYATEVGDETGTFARNIALSTFSSGELEDAREDVQDFGHSGDGFWFQGTGISVVDNISAGAEGSAFIFYTRGLKEGPVPKARFLTTNLTDPSIAQGADTIAVGQVPMREFHGNVGYASRTGLIVRYHLQNPTHSAQSLFRDSTFWNNETGVSLASAEQTILRNLTIIRSPVVGDSSVGVNTTGASKDIVYDQLTVAGYFRGINVARHGDSLVFGGVFVTRYAIVIWPALETNRKVVIQGPITFASMPPDYLPSGMTEVEMRFDTSAYYGSIDHLFYNNTVILNYGSHVNQQVYFVEQATTAVPFPEAGPGIPPQYVGLTSLELRDQYGLRIGGRLISPNAGTDPLIAGLLGVNSP